jgi:hypothetical protein
MREILKILTDINSLKALGRPFFPALSRVLLIVFGMMLGILAVYAGLPFLGVRFTTADPVHLTEGNKDAWVKNAAIAYQQGVYSDPQAVVKSDLERAGYGPAEIQALADANLDAPAIQQALLAVQSIPSQEAADDARGRVSSNILSNFLGPIFCLFGFLIIYTVIGIILTFQPIPVGKWRKGAIASHESTSGLGEKERERRRALESARGQISEQAEDEFLGEPLANFMSAYVLGDDLYDDSFALEPNGGFAGECGIGIAETIGANDPKKVTAFEVWVFDQAEIQTLTYVLMSEHAYNDQGLRAKLAPRGEAILAAPGKVFNLETKMLKMQVRIIDLQYGEGSLPPNSFFERITYSLTVWLKDGSAAPDGSSDDFMPSPIMTPAPPPMGNFAPPPPMPANPMPPQGGQMPMPPQPLPPPPMSPQGGMPPLPPMPPQGGQMPMPPQPLPPQPMRPQGNPMPPQPLPPQPMPPQGGMPPAGGIRPLTPNAPGGQMPLPPQPPGGQMPLPPQTFPTRQPPPSPDQPTVPGRRAPDDPFGDTTENEF